MKRRIIAVAGWALLLVLVAGPLAVGKDLGTDVLGNISPQSQLSGGLADQYPFSAYSLDYHTDVGITQLDGVPPTIAQWAAAQLWSLTSFLVKTVIDLFTWAFSLDLLGGAPGQQGGALAPVANAITSVYENVIGEAWMVVAIVLAGMWGIWKALVQRRYTETAGALALSVVFVLIALFFVYEPERTIGQASGWTNTMSLAFLSGANRGTVDDPAQAKRHVADQLFGAFVYQPWVVLEFGGLRHCVDTDHLDDDGYPRPVSPHDPGRDVCRDHLRQSADGHGGYAPRFLRYPAGSKERNAEYDALRKGSDAVRSQRTVPRLPGGQDRLARRRHPARARRLPAPDPRGRVLRRRAGRGRAAGVPVAGGDPRPGRRAGAAGLRAGRAGDRDLPARGTRLLSQLAGQARHRGLHQGPVLTGDRDRRRGRRRTTGLDRVTRVPVLLRPAGDLLLGDLRLPQADHRPPRRRHHRRRLRRTHATDDGRAARRRRRHPAVRGARRDARPRRTRRQRPPGERARRQSRSRDEQRRARSRTGSTTTIPPPAPSRWSTGNGSGNGHGPLAAAPPAPRRRPGRPRRRAATARRPSSDPADPPAVRARVRRAEPKHELSPRASHEDAMRRARELRERQRTGADDGAGRS